MCGYIQMNQYCCLSQCLFCFVERRLKLFYALNFLQILNVWSFRLHTYILYIFSKPTLANIQLPLVLCQTKIAIAYKNIKTYAMNINIRTNNSCLLILCLHGNSFDAYYRQILFWCRSVNSHEQKESSNSNLVFLSFIKFSQMFVRFGYATHFACNELQ